MQRKILRMKTLTVNRPSERNPEIIEAAADMLLPTIWDWVTASSSTENYPNDERETVRLELIRAIKSSTRGFDGYDLAKTIERQSMWEPDAELVDILDSYSRFLNQAHRDAVKAWVIENGIIPQKMVGDDVIVSVIRKEHNGTIVSVDLETAQYCVNIPDLGHEKCNFSVNENNKKILKITGSGTIGIIKPVEEIDD